MNNAASSFASESAQDDAAFSRVALSPLAFSRVAFSRVDESAKLERVLDAPQNSAEAAKNVAPAFNLGGQAIIEGVMMRSPHYIGAAIRRGDGKIETRVERFHSVLEKWPILRLPFVRGVVGLFEMMLVGTRWLRWSGDVAMHDSAPSDKAQSDKAQSEASSTRSGEVASQVPSWLFVLTAIGSFCIGLGLFLVLPAFLALRILGSGASSIQVSLIELVIKTILFVAYVWLIGQRKHIRRLFEYHGAEHKVVHATEAGRELIVDQCRDFPREHPRCGTGFALLVILVSALFFAFLPTDVPKWQSVIHRLCLLPLVAGVSYEILKLTLHPVLGKAIQLLMTPGTWLQRLTTREPDDMELEVSCAAMKAVIEAENADLKLTITD